MYLPPGLSGPSASWLGPPNNVKLIPLVSSSFNHLIIEINKDNGERVRVCPN